MPVTQAHIETMARAILEKHDPAKCSIAAIAAAILDTPDKHGAHREDCPIGKMAALCERLAAVRLAEIQALSTAEIRALRRSYALWSSEAARSLIAKDEDGKALPPEMFDAVARVLFNRVMNTIEEWMRTGVIDCGSDSWVMRAARDQRRKASAISQAAGEIVALFDENEQLRKALYATMGAISIEQIREELRRREATVAFAFWTLADARALVEADEDCKDLPSEAIDTVARDFFIARANSIESVMRERATDLGHAAWSVLREDLIPKHTKPTADDADPTP